MSKLLYKTDEWSVELLEKAWNVIDDIAKNKFGLDYYDSKVELVSAEQMLDAYSSIGLPSMYSHWSFGKSFIQNERAYQKGQQGLAYELIINTNPAIAYLMENNTMTMQCLVMAHAICGHASFFKNNYLFKKWTDADSIIDYLNYAKKYIAKCEEQHGVPRVEHLLDACHALQNYGVDQYKRPRKLKAEMAAQKQTEWLQYLQQLDDKLWNSNKEKAKVKEILQGIGSEPRILPEENILYFLEKHAPSLQSWEREIIRIVRNIAQYFYPQSQTKIMNEGWATYVHHTLMTELYDQGYISEGNYLEFLHSHCGVCCQQDYDSQYYSGINPYAIGFAMFKDLERIIDNPTGEDIKWFPDIAGQSDKKFEILQDIVADYRDESFILQFLSPKVIRDFKLFVLADNEELEFYTVEHVHDDDAVRHVRKALAVQVSRDSFVPKIEVSEVDPKTNFLTMIHTVIDGRMLEYNTAKKVMCYIHDLWDYDIELMYQDTEGEPVNKS